MLKQTLLGATDLKVSALCLGTNMFGTAYDQAKSNSLLDAFVAAGGNFIDTARSYGDWIPDAPKGASERAIGAWLKGQDRSSLVIATKGGFFDMRVGDWRPRITPEDIAADLEESLSHLGVDTIDLYWLHADNPGVAVELIIDALIAHQKAGRIRYFGASNWTPERIQAAQAYAASIGHAGFAAVQPFWGLASPNAEGAAAAGYGFYYEDGLAAVHADTLPMVPYAGQSRGVFAKWIDGGEEALRDDLKAMYVNDANRARLPVLKSVAEARGVSVNDVVLAYLTSQPLQTVPIIGASSVEQLKESLKAASIALDAGELARLRHP
ncbi:MAG: aldo/keto reductase [Candidatus Brevundimonas phytovorans]|nr:aldo/keto reductase [Brevundimonas sp.]WEK56750.1 MAG: aldo/keto reductase [Brevundimonas sp.]